MSWAGSSPARSPHINCNTMEHCTIRTVNARQTDGTFTFKVRIIVARNPGSRNEPLPLYAADQDLQFSARLPLYGARSGETVEPWTPTSRRHTAKEIQIGRASCRERV